MVIFGRRTGRAGGNLIVTGQFFPVGLYLGHHLYVALLRVCLAQIAELVPRVPLYKTVILDWMVVIPVAYHFALFTKSRRPGALVVF